MEPWFSDRIGIFGAGEAVGPLASAGILSLDDANSFTEANTDRDKSLTSSLGLGGIQYLNLQSQSFLLVPR